MLELMPEGEVFVGSPDPFEPEAGYVQEEFTAEGTATSYVRGGRAHR